MTITLSHGGPSIYSSASRSDSVAVGTINGVAFIERNGDGWRVSHRGLEGKHIHAVVVEPTSGTIFAGANHGSHLRQRRRRTHLGATGQRPHRDRCLQHGSHGSGRQSTHFRRN